MLVNKAYKFRIYPNREQEALIVKTIGCSRFVYNYFLAKWDNVYEETGRGLNYNACSAELTQLKKELTWLKEVDSIAVQSSLTQQNKRYSLTLVSSVLRVSLWKASSFGLLLPIGVPMRLSPSSKRTCLLLVLSNCTSWVSPPLRKSSVTIT